MGRIPTNSAAWFELDENDAKALRLKHPARQAVDMLQKAIDTAGLSNEYQVGRYESDEPGVWVVKATRLPPAPMATAKREVRIERQEQRAPVPRLKL